MTRSGKKGLPLGPVVGALIWTLGTLWLGVVASCRGVRIVGRLPLLLSKTLRCPRGHAVPAYGVFSCGTCRAQFEGYAFSPCPSCGGLASYIACPSCGLSVRDPLR